MTERFVTGRFCMASTHPIPLPLRQKWHTAWKNGKKLPFYFAFRQPFTIFADRKNQTLVIMKEYIHPNIKCRKARTQPIAIDIYSDMGDEGQYTNTAEMEADQPFPTSHKSIWGE